MLCFMSNDVNIAAIRCMTSFKTIYHFPFYLNNNEIITRVYRLFYRSAIVLRLTKLKTNFNETFENKI